MDEAKLVAAAQRGDKQAFSQLVEIYQTPLFRTALGILGSRDDALDAVQDAFWQALKSLNKLSDPAAYKSWQIRILVNKCLDSIRRNKKVVAWEDFSLLPQAERDHDLQMDMAAALGRLEDKYRLILSLRYFQDLSIEDMAKVLDCPEGTVKSRLNYALTKLRQELKYSREVVK